MRVVTGLEDTAGVCVRTGAQTPAVVSFFSTMPREAPFARQNPAGLAKQVSAAVSLPNLSPGERKDPGRGISRVLDVHSSASRPSLPCLARCTRNASDRATMFRRHALAYAAAAMLAALPVLTSAAEAQARARDPILFVHGWRGRAEQWRPMMELFVDDGWSRARLYAWTLDPRDSNPAAAAKIAARVDQILAATGARRVDIVTHSMGALSTRYYLKNLESGGKVDAWVSLGGPNHGIHLADLCISADCADMRRGSAFLAALNRGDETPGRARYATWRSPCDEIIDPVDTVVLEGADNHLTGCVSHLGLLRDPAIYRAVRDFVSRRSSAVVHASPPASMLLRRERGRVSVQTSSM